MQAGNVVWRKKENHRKQNHQHTKKWDDVMNDPVNHSHESKNCRNFAGGNRIARCASETTRPHAIKTEIK